MRHSEQPWARLKAARRIKKHTQAEVAAVCGVSRAAVSLWERSPDEGGNPPSMENAAILAELLGVPIEHLYGVSSKNAKPTHQFDQSAISRIVEILEQHKGKKRRAPYGSEPNALVQQLHDYFQTHVPLVPWSLLVDYANHNRRKDVTAGCERVPCPVRWSKDLIAFRVTDDSMNGTNSKQYPKGSTVFVDLSSNVDAQPYERVLATTWTSHNNIPKPTIWFREYAEDNDGAYLRALNKKYKTPRVSFDVVGVVVGKFEYG